MRAPLVSVIMPAFNAERFVDVAITSVLAQPVADVELIVVDDGSTDATPDILAAWAARDERVLVVRQSNRGVSAARNAAFARARGRWFALLDADDEWASEYLSIQIPALERLRRGGVATPNAYQRGGPQDGGLLRPGPARVRHLRVRDLIDDDAAVCVMSLFGREVYDAIGGFDERLRHSEDYHFWIRAALAGFPIVQRPEPLGWYRRHAASASSNERAMLDGMRVVLRETRTRCAGDPDLLRAIDAQLRRCDREQYVLDGKRALMDGSFPDAAAAFEHAAKLDGSPKLRAVAFACRFAPRSLRAVYSRRSSAV